MPCGKRVGSGCRLPLASRVSALQQSSLPDVNVTWHATTCTYMLTYSYPSACRPCATIASAEDMTSSACTLWRCVRNVQSGLPSVHWSIAPHASSVHHVFCQMLSRSIKSRDPYSITGLRAM